MGVSIDALAFGGRLLVGESIDRLIEQLLHLQIVVGVDLHRIGRLVVRQDQEAIVRDVQFDTSVLAVADCVGKQTGRERDENLATDDASLPESARTIEF